MSLANLQVVDVLMLVGNIAPIAVYFLCLGLVNSHARPCLVSSRSDFISLSIALVPVLLWPLPVLAGARAWWLLAAGLLCAAVVFWKFLPAAGGGFVIYNISESRFTRVLEEAFRRMGLVGAWEGPIWQAADSDLRVTIRKFALLRNVTLSIEADSPSGRRQASTLEARVRSGLACVNQLPSTMGACLVLIGVGLLIVPMWTFGRHIQDIVDAMSHILG